MAQGRREALAAHQRGALEEALAIQRTVLARKSPRPEERDFLVMGLLLHAKKDFAGSLAALREGTKHYPDSAELHENVGVLSISAKDYAGGVAALERALALGSQSLNVHDSLCNALARVGRHGEALAHGRQSLEGKDARFGKGTAFALPTAPPPPFDPSRSEQNVISYVLWGDDPRYRFPLLETLRIRPHLFPAWTIRIYVDASVPQDLRKQLEQAGAQVIAREQPKGEPSVRRLLWRFDVIADPGVKRFLVRDADSLLTVKERVA